MGNNEIVYDLKNGEKYTYNVFSARDIELLAEERTGIYSWHMRLHPKGSLTDNIKSFCNVMASKSYDINFSSNLKDQFNGKATKKALEIDEEMDTDVLLSKVTAILCPPIYIGISKNIKSRLVTHKKALLDFLENNVALIEPNDKDVSYEDDSEAESSKFAQRVGKVLAKNGVINEAPLFIKAIYLDGISRKSLRQCESFVNRNFHPLFGLR
jgi:hypothetical protein